MSIQNKTTEFLIRHNYILGVVFVNNTITCKFNDKSWSYIYDPLDKVKKDLYKLTFVYNEKVESLILPAFIVRWYVFLDILRFCRNNNLSYHIIKYFDSTGDQTEFSDGFDLKLPESVSAKELLIQQHVTAGINNKDFSAEKELEELGLLHTWILLKGLLI